MTKPRKRLTDVMNGHDADDLARMYRDTEAAKDMVPLPRGTYRCRIVDGEFIEAKSGTKGYQLAFAVIDGEHKGRRVWDTCWLTPAALPMSKQRLSKLGVDDLAVLDNPLPQGIVCSVKVVLREDDDGTERNRVVSFDVVDVIVDPTADGDFAEPPPEGTA
jgi:hypothetical protein